MEAHQTTVDSWQSLVSVLREIEGKCVWGCRGEPKHYPDCSATLDRLTVDRWKDDLAGRLFIEQVIVARFREQATPYLTEAEREVVNSGLASIILMRHFGTPTRLVDWSESLWIAAYFATGSCPREDARIRYFDRYRLTETVKQHFDCETSTFGSAAPSGNYRLFDHETVRKYRRWVTCYYLFGTRFPRLISQQGLFTLTSKPFEDHWLMIQEMLALGDPGLGCGEIVIKKEAKPEILQGLTRMGITAASLYPGLDGIGMSLTALTQYCHMDIGIQEMLGRNWRDKPVR